MAVNHLSPVEVKNILEYTFKNNIRLAKEGKKPVAIEVEGNAGIGKTSIIIRVIINDNTPIIITKFMIYNFKLLIISIIRKITKKVTKYFYFCII